MAKPQEERISELYTTLIDGFQEGSSEDMSSLEAILTVRGFSYEIEKRYAEELGLDPEQLDEVVTKLVQNTDQETGVIEPEVLSEVAGDAEEFFGE